MTISNLQRAIDTLNKAFYDLHDNDLFAKVINDAVWILGMRFIDIRNEFGISKPTLRNWIEGTGAPHIGMRPYVYEYFLGKAQQMLKDANDT